MDEGKVTPDSFAVYYNTEKWFDPPEVRHSGGQVFSFVDNHAEIWKWSKETSDFATVGTDITMSRQPLQVNRTFIKCSLAAGENSDIRIPLRSQLIKNPSDSLKRDCDS